MLWIYSVSKGELLVPSLRLVQLSRSVEGAKSSVDDAVSI